MIVRELIEGAVWRPGRDHAGAEPIVSVLLPTYRRAASGRFRRAAESVLAQTLEALELIIIDDGSTDGTAQQIEQLMDEDGRVSCITHRQNVGLPALSIYEGYARARAPYLGFAFDDFVFRRTALERLAKAAVRSQADVLHGYARVINPRGRAWLLGRRGTDFISYERLRQQNVIPNAAVLLRKTVVDVVGWFDPHVCLVRACDFDYWGRLARRYVIEYAPVNVGTEFGPSLSDSLGNTHPWDMDETFEFMRCDRNHLLTPAAFLERNVVECPEGASERLRLATGRAEARRRTQFAMPPRQDREPPVLPADNQRLIIVGQPEAWLSLVFDGVFKHRGPVKMTWAPYGDGPTDLPRLLGATAVIFDIRLFARPSFGDMLSACEALRIPAYLIADDNFFVVEEELRDPHLRAFEQQSTIDTIRRLTGLILTSEPLREDARARRLNDNILMLSPVLDDDLLPTGEHTPQGPGAPLRIAMSGGPHRDGHFEEVVVPALNDLSPAFPIELLVRREDARIRRLVDPRIRIESPGFFVSFSEFVRRWRRHQPNVLLHPRGRTRNIDFKTDNAVLVAYLLGAVPVLPPERAYAALGEAEGVVKVTTDGPDAWREAIASLADPDCWQRARARLALFCEARFSARQNEEVLQHLLGAHDACGPGLYDERARALDRLLIQTSEADRAARFEQIQTLTQALRASEADRAARFEQIQTLTQALQTSEADRAARFEQIQTLTQALQASEADRAARFEQIQALTQALQASEADRTARFEQIQTLTQALQGSPGTHGRTKLFDPDVRALQIP